LFIQLDVFFHHAFAREPLLEGSAASAAVDLADAVAGSSFYAFKLGYLSRGYPSRRYSRI